MGFMGFGVSGLKGVGGVQVFREALGEGRAWVGSFGL